MEGKMHIQIVDKLDEFNSRITAENTNVTKDMLQRKRRTPGGMYEESKMTLTVKCFTPNNFSVAI